MLGGGLFSRYFLDTGVRTTAAWIALPEEDVAVFASAARANLNSFQRQPSRRTRLSLKNVSFFPRLELEIAIAMSPNDA
jgi:hypothetical protein